MARRLLALSFLIAAVAAVVAIVAGTRGGHHEPEKADTRPVSKPAPKPVLGDRTVASPAPKSSLPPAPEQVSGAAAQRMPIPILMYHVIGVRPAAAVYPELWVSPATFAAEMAALKRGGWWAITLRQAYDAWRQGGSLPRRPVIVSFDDGYLGDYTHARPVLSRLGWPGLLNLELRNVRAGDLTERQVRALIRAGWEIDSHTIDHPDLTTVTDQQLKYELVGSRRQLQREFGVPADFFCYPAGRFDDHVIAAVRAAGYLGATTEVEGYATPTNLYTLDRIRVRDTDTAATLLQRLRSLRSGTL